MKRGIMFALLASVISGIAIFYSKISVTKIDPLVLTTSRNLWVALIFILLLIINKFSELKKLQINDLFKLILIGIIGGAIPFYLFFTGLKFTNSLTANFIHKTLFIWVAVLGSIFLKEKIKPIYLLSFILIFIGNLFFVPKSFYFNKGELMILTATILWAIENVIAKKVLKNVSSNTVGLFRMGLGSLLLLTTVTLTGKGSLLLALSPQQLMTIFIGGTILFFYVFTWYKALKYTSAGLVTMVLSFSIVVGNILNGSFAGIKLSANEILSSLSITGAILFFYFANLRSIISGWINKES